MLPVEKKVGDLDYTLLRTPATKLTEKELGYCEYDCLVIYYYIKIKVKSRLVGLKSIKSYVKVNRSNTRNIRQVYRKGRLLTEQTLNQF